MAEMNSIRGNDQKSKDINDVLSVIDIESFMIPFMLKKKNQPYCNHSYFKHVFSSKIS